jgi:hypothetical protein
MADADDADADAKSSPQAASSNEEESKTYQMLVKEIFLQQWSQDDDKDLEAYLTLIGNAEEYPDALCDAAVAAFQGKRDMISQQAKISKRTVSGLAETSRPLWRVYAATIVGSQRPPLGPRPGARYRGAMRQIERPILLILAAVLAFGALAAAMVLWGLR